MPAFFRVSPECFVRFPRAQRAHCQPGGKSRAPRAHTGSRTCRTRKRCAGSTCSTRSCSGPRGTPCLQRPRDRGGHARGAAGRRCPGRAGHGPGAFLVVHRRGTVASRIPETGAQSRVRSVSLFSSTSIQALRGSASSTSSSVGIRCPPPTSMLRSCARLMAFTEPPRRATLSVVAPWMTT